MSSKTVPWGACALVLSFVAAPGVRAEVEGPRPPAATPTATATSTSTATATSTPTSTAEPTLPPVRLEEVVVRLPRTEAAGDPTASATVIEASRFAGEAKDVAALVATAPGVAVNDYGGLGQVATVSIRGSMATGVLVLLDGVPLDGGTAAGSDLASIPRHWVRRLEVIRGAEGAHFGAGALAGVVNVVTRRPEAGAWSAEAGAGSFGTFTAAADGGLAAGPWTVWVAGSVDGSRGDFPYLFDPQPSLEGNPLEPKLRANNGATRAGLLVKGSRPAGPWQLDLVGQLSGGRRELAGSPYALTPDDWQEDARLALSARLAGPGWRDGLDLALRATARLDRQVARLAPAQSATAQDGAGGGLTGEAAVIHPGGLLRLAAALTGEALRAEGPGEDHARLGAAVSASEDLMLAAGALRLAPAVRLEVVGPFAGWSAKLGASAPLGGPATLRASVGRAFRAPSFEELYLVQGLVTPNPDLKPETGVAADASVALEGPAGLLSLGGFAQLYQDLILYQRATYERFKPFNAGKALTSGLEVQAALAPRRDLLGLSADASYTLLATENLKGDAGALGKWLPFRARHRLYGRLGVEPGPAELHAEVHHVGLQYQDPDNTAAIPASLVWSAGGSLRLWRRPAARLHLEVKNLTDDRTLVDGLGHPLPARLVMVTLRAGSTTEGTP